MEKQVPKDFGFSIKAPQRITHMKNLNDVDEDTRYFLDIIISLGNKLGMVLFQFPPYFRKNLELLQNFTDLLPKNIAATFEFRYEEWFKDDVYSCLNEKTFHYVFQKPIKIRKLILPVLLQKEI
jgi:uncharacterized protein YecE (DUF72 family)